ncbi:MAG: DUF3168 domain-containing protein [Devosiaceae bacterium]|nr:DUF3168 domain-containing protein [Devosiaceae bacterium]
MSHPIIELQTSIISQLNADVPLTSAIGADGIFDMPPKGRSDPFLVFSRHDLIARDSDISPGNDHRIQIAIWVPEPNRAKALALAERVIQVVQIEPLNTINLRVTTVTHLRTDTAIEKKTGRAYATIYFRILSEPTA